MDADLYPAALHDTENMIRMLLNKNLLENVY